MRLTLRIVALVVASVLAFMVLAMAEARDVFGPWMRGEVVAPEPIAEERIDAALRQLATDLRAGTPVGVAGTIARLADEEDRRFRAAQDVSQDLELLSLRVERVTAVGPGTVDVTTEERSRLRISKAEGAPRSYALSGSWQYTLREGRDGDRLEVVDLRPLSVALEEIAAEPSR